MTGSAVRAYVAQVDRALGAGQAMYAAPAVPAGMSSAPVVLESPPLGSGLATGVGEAADRYRQQSHAYSALTPTVQPLPAAPNGSKAPPARPVSATARAPKPPPSPRPRAPRPE